MGMPSKSHINGQSLNWTGIPEISSGTQPFTELVDVLRIPCPGEFVKVDLLARACAIAAESLEHQGKGHPGK